MTNSDSDECASQDPSFELARNKAHESVPILAWEVLLKNESELWSGQVTAFANEKAPVKQGSRQIKNCCPNEGHVIVQEDKSAVHCLDATELETFVKESLDDILKRSFHNVQTGI